MEQIYIDFAQKSRAHSSTTTDIGYLTTSPQGAIGSLNNSWNGFTHPPSKNSNLTNLWINGKAKTNILIKAKINSFLIYF